MMGAREMGMPFDDSVLREAREVDLEF